jgi:hypothetical protein
MYISRQLLHLVLFSSAIDLFLSGSRALLVTDERGDELNILNPTFKKLTFLFKRRGSFLF